MKKVTTILVLLMISSIGWGQKRSVISKNDLDKNNLIVTTNDLIEDKAKHELKNFEENLANSIYILNNIETQYGEFRSTQKFTESMNIEIAEALEKFIVIKKSKISLRDLQDLNNRFRKTNLNSVIKLKLIWMLDNTKISKPNKTKCEQLVRINANPEEFYNKNELKFINQEAKEFLELRTIFKQ